MKTHIITHHSGGTDANPYTSTAHHTVADIDAWHKLRWPDFKSNRGYWVGYHYVIEADGKTTHTRDDNEEGAHCIGMNNSGIGVCFTGNFSSVSPDMPTKAQLEAWRGLATRLMKQYNIPLANIQPHRAYQSYKDCHGSKLADRYFQTALIDTPTAKKTIRDDEAKRKELETLMQALIRKLQALLTEKKARVLGGVMLKSSFRERMQKVDGGVRHYKLESHI